MTTLAASVRAAQRESVVINAILRLIDAARSAAANLSAPRTAAPVADDGSLDDSIDGSRTVRAARSVLEAFDRIWLDSAAHAAIQPVQRSLRALTAEQRIRVAGLWLAVAALTVGLLSLADPRPSGVIRWLLWAASLFVGVAAAVAAPPLHAAWLGWRRTR
jgi:hypothetical protein